MMIAKTHFFLYITAIFLSSVACNQQKSTRLEAENEKAASQHITITLDQVADTASTKMVWIPAQTFSMGSNEPEFPDASPVHDVEIDGFWMDEHEVTYGQYAAFVKATNYKTIAEQPLNPADYPGVDPSKLVPGSAVFVATANEVPLDNALQWWQYIPGANWLQPKGPGTVNTELRNKPVVHIAYEDAAAYARWAGKRLPTEAEWECAARAGKTNQKYYWGNELKPGNKWAANIYQGNFPDKNTSEDGYTGVAPVKSFAPNAYGLYDMEGNVWEWCSDLYTPDYYSESSVKNPQGPSSSYDPDEPGMEKRVQRGGSFLCSDQYCIRYKPGSRGKGDVKSGSDNLGFRCVSDKAPK